MRRKIKKSEPTPETALSAYEACCMEGGGLRVSPLAESFGVSPEKFKALLERAKSARAQRRKEVFVL